MKINRKILNQMINKGEINFVGRRANSSGTPSMSGGSVAGSRSSSSAKSSPSTAEPATDADIQKTLQDHEERIAQLEQEIKSLLSAGSKIK